MREFPEGGSMESVLAEQGFWRLTRAAGGNLHTLLAALHIYAKQNKYLHICWVRGVVFLPSMTYWNPDR